MSYIPKSKYKLTHTGNGEYLHSKGSFKGQPYSGPIILTSEGAYAGNDPKDLSYKLKKQPRKNKNQKQN